jgi:glycosyltransferase involved in cell wall biosynthesis
MTQKPILSVIIASYNHQDYIVETLKSLEKQTFQDFEIIVIDDGSTDNTVQTIRSFPSRAQLFTQNNQGVVAARNRGVALAAGKYLCFVDSDDVVQPDRFEKQVRLMEQDSGIGMVFADVNIINAAGEIIGKFSDVYPVVPGDIAENLLLYYCFVPMLSVMVRAEVLHKAGPFEKPGPISDYIKWIEVSHISKVRYEPLIAGCWRRHQRSVSKMADKTQTYANIRMTIRRLLRRYPDLRAKLGKRINRRFSKTYFLTGFWLAADGDIERAKKYYCKAIKLHRLSIESWGGLLLTLFPIKAAVTGLHKYVRAKKLPW